MSDKAQKTLMEVLHDLEEDDDDEGWRVRYGRGNFGKMSIREQVRLVADADVSAYFMRDGAGDPLQKPSLARRLWDTEKKLNVADTG